MKLWFEERRELAPTIWEYRFRPERPVDYIPGQYADFHLLKLLNDPRGQSRVFSITSLPSDPSVSFVAKWIPPLSPYKQALQTLQPGDELRLDDALGDLVLPKLPTIPLVFIAGGIGIASFVAMIRQLLADKEERQIFFFYTLRSRQEQIFRDITDSYPLALKSITIAPHRLTADEITASVPAESLFYISGSERFVEGLRGGLKANGITHEQIIFDFFDGYAEL
jgi:glycine betaine catabolism B